MYIPIFALRAYRVVPTDDGWHYLGRVPVSDSARLLGAFLSVSILVGGGYLGVNAYFNSPGYLASQKMVEANRLAAAGHIGEAAKLLAAVAIGPTALDRPAAQELARLLDNGASEVPTLRGSASPSAQRWSSRRPVAGEDRRNSCMIVG